ncbi:MAG: DUF5615 family PIN-like protein [Pseudonocardia sp.]
MAGADGLWAELGHDAVHVRDLGVEACPDSEVAAAATRGDRVLATSTGVTGCWSPRTSRTAPAGGI